jgi:hypothetical protein
MCEADQIKPTTRRKFTFWLGFGLFALSERLHAQVLDEVAAAAMRGTEPKAKQPQSQAQAQEPTSQEVVESAEHWSAAQNSQWTWFERESLVDGRWKLTGITTPVNRLTGELYTGQTGYLSEKLVPAELRSRESDPWTIISDYAADGPEEGQPLAERRDRHGRPPSKWLRSLNAAELHIWLKSIKVPEAGVSGMTFMTHLTRDHSFDADKIEKLSEDDLAKLHAAAHYGY